MFTSTTKQSITTNIDVAVALDNLIFKQGVSKFTDKQEDLSKQFLVIDSEYQIILIKSSNMSAAKVSDPCSHWMNAALQSFIGYLLLELQVDELTKHTGAIVL